MSLLPGPLQADHCLCLGHGQRLSRRPTRDHRLERLRVTQLTLGLLTIDPDDHGHGHVCFRSR